jgi:hypothetical protein
MHDQKRQDLLTLIKSLGIIIHLSNRLMLERESCVTPVAMLPKSFHCDSFAPLQVLLKPTLNSKPAQNQHHGIDKSPDKWDPRTHAKVSRIIHTPKQRTRDTSRQQTLHGGNDCIDDPYQPDYFPILTVAPE